MDFRQVLFEQNKKAQRGEAQAEADSGKEVKV